MRTQHENFTHMIASPFNSEPQYDNWESVIRGSNDMMGMLYDKVGNMLAPRNKPNVIDTKKQIVFSYYDKGKVIVLDAQEFRFYITTLIELKTLPSTDGSGSGTLFPISPYYDKDNPAFMSHKYISRALRQRACEILYQTLLKFHRQPSGAQLPGYTTINGFQEGPWDGPKYAAGWKLINSLNGRNSSLDHASDHQDYILLGFDPRKHDFTHFLKALDSLRNELHELDERERRITDDELLEKAHNTLIRAFGMGNYRTADNGPFNNLLCDLAQDLIQG